MPMTRVVLAATSYTSLETVVDALGEGEIVIRTDLTDLDVGLVTGGQTPTALPEVDDADVAVRVIKPLESTLELWAHSVVGGNIYITRSGPPIIIDTTGVTSS